MPDNSTEQPRDVDTSNDDATTLEALKAQLEEYKRKAEKAAHYEEETIERRKENKRLAEQLEAERRAKLEKSGEYKELAEQLQKENSELTSIKAEYEAMQQAILESNQRRVESIPEDKRSLIPADYEPAKLSKWLDANVSLLTKPAVPNIDAGVRSSGAASKPVNLTPEEKQIADKLNISHEDYAQRKGVE